MKLDVSNDVRYFYGGMGYHIECHPYLLFYLKEEMIAKIFLHYKLHSQLEKAQNMAKELSKIDQEFFLRVLRYMEGEDWVFFQSVLKKDR